MKMPYEFVHFIRVQLSSTKNATGAARFCVPPQLLLHLALPQWALEFHHFTILRGHFVAGLCVTSFGWVDMTDGMRSGCSMMLATTHLLID